VKVGSPIKGRAIKDDLKPEKTGRHSEKKFSLNIEPIKSGGELSPRMKNRKVKKAKADKNNKKARGQSAAARSVRPGQKMISLY
jgi:hypothetical protein